MTEDQNLVKSDHCLQLFSSRRQPPLLVKETPLAYVLKRGVSQCKLVLYRLFVDVSHYLVTGFLPTVLLSCQLWVSCSRWYLQIVLQVLVNLNKFEQTTSAVVILSNAHGQTTSFPVQCCCFTTQVIDIWTSIMGNISSKN